MCKYFYSHLYLNIFLQTNPVSFSSVRLVSLATARYDEGQQRRHQASRSPNPPTPASARTKRGSLVHLHRQATSEIEIYYGGGSPDCCRPHHSLAHSLRRTLFGKICMSRLVSSSCMSRVGFKSI